MKQCTGCKESRNLSQFSKDARSKDGLQLRCKTCNDFYYRANREKKLNYGKEYCQKHAEDIKAYKKEYRIANQDAIRLDSHNRYMSDREGRLLKSKTYQKLHKEKYALYSKQYFQNNKDVLLQRSAQYRKNHSKKISTYLSIYRKINKEKLSAMQKAYYVSNPNKEYRAAYRKSNPHVHAAINAKRRAAKLQRTPQWLSKLQKDNMKLFYEAAAKMTKEIGIKFAVDHIIPLQNENVSGLHVPWNLQVLTKKENCSKGNEF